MEELIDIVDENNNLTGKVKEKEKAHADGDFHRTVHIWIINSKEEVLLQQRSATKSTYPNEWDISSAGHIQVGEEILDAAKRELSEELGIFAKEEDFLFIGIVKREEPTNKEYAYNYILNLDKNLEDYKFCDHEVQAVKYVPYQVFKKWVIEREEGIHPDLGITNRLFEYMNNK